MAEARMRWEALARDGASIRREIRHEEIEALEAVGEEMRSLRKRCGLSLQQPALPAGFDFSYLSKIERGARRSRLTTLERLAVVLVEHDLEPPPRRGSGGPSGGAGGLVAGPAEPVPVDEARRQRRKERSVRRREQKRRAAEKNKQADASRRENRFATFRRANQMFRG